MRFGERRDIINQNRTYTVFSLLVIPVMVMLLFPGSFFTIDSQQNFVLADEKMSFNSSKTIPPAITLSNGKVLSRALWLDSSLLAQTKDAINHGVSDPILKTAMDEVISQANNFLSERPTSVIDKVEKPASGDKHDFLSLAPYRWPDPDKPNGKPYKNIDGKLNPEVYSVPDKRNMDDMVYRVKILSLAYYFTNNSQYASKAGDLLRVWFLNNGTSMNPNLEYAEVVRGENNNNGTMRGILHGKYLPDLFDAIRLLPATSWSKLDQQGIKIWFTKYLNWLLNSEHGKEERNNPNNHGTWYRVQASSIALFLNMTDIAKSLLQDARDKLIAEQIEPSGASSRELVRRNALDYSTFNVLGLFRLATLGEHFGIDLWNYTTPQGAGLQKALDYLLPSLLGKETWPHQQFKLIDRKNMVDLLCRAAVHYETNQSYTEACKSASAKDINASLSHPP